jgi:hypothetical protein
MGFFMMADDLKLNQAIALISEAIADAYQRGKADAINAMVAAASGAMQQGGSVIAPSLTLAAHESSQNDEGGRVRAPKGSAERVIRRAINAASDKGAAVSEIMAARDGELEMMLAESSIRGELRRGEKSNPQKYVEIEGRWFIDPV